MALTDPQKVKLVGAAAAIAAALGVVIVASDSNIAVSQQPADAGLASTRQRRMTADIHSELAEPGATGSTVIGLPSGASAFEVVGPRDFTVVSTSVRQIPGPPRGPSVTALTITFTNNATVRKRFVGFVSYTSPRGG
jgi:hypothetical protein